MHKMYIFVALIAGYFLWLQAARSSDHPVSGNTFLADARWHTIELRFERRHVIISVDRQSLVHRAHEALSDERLLTAEWTRPNSGNRCAFVSCDNRTTVLPVI